MTMTVTGAAEASGSARSMLPAAAGAGVYFILLLAGNKLLGDPDTQWQITIGRWILANGMVPRSDVYSFTMSGQPWISTQWLAQVGFALAYRCAGWAGLVVMTAAAAAAAFALLTKFLSARLTPATTAIIVTGALVLSAGHLLARPHVLALPILVAWVSGLVAAADHGESPSPLLLPLMTLWANVHGGFVFGLAIILPIAVEAVARKDSAARAPLARRWLVFACAALVASFITPYGWNALLASGRILSLGDALPLITEWHPVSFDRVGAFEICLLGLLGFALWRGIALPLLRILLLLGLLHMALSSVRNLELLALVAPIVLAAPLAQQLGHAENVREPRGPASFYVAVALLIFTTTPLIALFGHYTPSDQNSPAAAVAEIKRLHVSRVFNDYDFGGYLIAHGVPTFIDGRTELFGERFVVDHRLATDLIEPEKLFTLLNDYRIEATLLRTQTAAAKLLDHLDGWRKAYSDGVATIHVRTPESVAHLSDPIANRLLGKTWHPFSSRTNGMRWAERSARSQ
jgi:hypothetical protein